MADELPGHGPGTAGNGKQPAEAELAAGLIGEDLPAEDSSEGGLPEGGLPDVDLADGVLPEGGLPIVDLADGVRNGGDPLIGDPAAGEAALDMSSDYDLPPRGPSLLQRFGTPERGDSLPPYQPPGHGERPEPPASLAASDPYDEGYGTESYASPEGYATGDVYDQPDYFPPDPYLSGQSYYPPDSYGPADSYGTADLYGSADPYNQPEIFSPSSSPPFPPAPDPGLLSGAPPPPAGSLAGDPLAGDPRAGDPRAGDPRSTDPWTFDPWSAGSRPAGPGSGPGPSPGVAPLAGLGRPAGPGRPAVTHARAGARGRRGAGARGGPAGVGPAGVGPAGVGPAADGRTGAGQAPVLPGQPRPGQWPDTTESLTPEFLLPARRRPPSPGWRKLLFQVSGGLVRIPASAAELRRRDMIGRVRTPVAGGHHRVAVLSLKGGVGKTTTAVGLGATLASLRGDRVIAVDGNPDRGTLSDKVRLETAATVRDLLNERGQIERYADVRAFTSQAGSRLEVLASDRDPTVSVAFSEDDYCEVSRVLEHYYSICITDCGTGLLHSAMAGILRLADQIVLVSSPSVDGARSASATLDWLAAHSYGDLVQNAVVVLSIIRPSSNSTVDLDRLEQHFAARCRAVTRIPYDGHLEEGAEVELDQLSRPAADAYLALAALVGDGLAAPHRA